MLLNIVQLLGMEKNSYSYTRIDYQVCEDIRV